MRRQTHRAIGRLKRGSIGYGDDVEFAVLAEIRQGLGVVDADDDTASI